VASPRPPSARSKPRKPKRRRRHRTRAIYLIAITVLLASSGLASGTYYVDGVPTPSELPLPESTTIYFADERTPMATLGKENRTLLKYEEMNDAVRQAIVAAEDQSFWANEGIDLRGVLRAAWNNVSGGDTQGGSTITQQYARVAADLKGVTYSRKLREAVIAWKLADKYSKEEILEFYLNTVPFGRGAYGVEAAAQAYLGKTANRHAPAYLQVTVAEAMVLVSMVKQPEPDPDDPDRHPGYDPTRGPVALKNSKARWDYVEGAMERMGYLTQAQAKAMVYPEGAVKAFDPASRQSGLDRPTGLVVSHVLSELRQTEPFRGKGPDYIDNGGFRIITTIDKEAQDAAEAAADIRRTTAPEIVQGQPANWQAALVAVEPGTGRVLAYYGGSKGTGADYAGWFYDANGDPHGFGAHPPGSSFKVYDLAEALRQGISLNSVWDAPATKEFPASGRTGKTPAGPVRNTTSAPCQPKCTLTEAAVASLNVPFFDLTEKLGTASVIEMARKAGIDDMWANVAGQPNPVRIDLRDKAGADLAADFSTEVGIGQYGITVTDHANGMATMAAGGKQAHAHFVKSVLKGRDHLYAEALTQTDIGLSANQIAELNATLTKVAAAKLGNEWDAGGKTGTWQAGTSTTHNAHAWMVGYTRALAAAVWIGTADGEALVTKTGSPDVYGSNYPGPIWRQFMERATLTMQLDPAWRKFDRPKVMEPMNGAQASTEPSTRQPATIANRVRRSRSRLVSASGMRV
jgi:membrane peptidoglycan carboxypeptidase